MKQVFIEKQNVISNFIGLSDRIINNYENFGVKIGFYFTHSYLDVDITDGIDSFIEIVNYMKNIQIDNLTYYYFIDSYNDITYIFVSNETLIDMNNDDIRSIIRKDIVNPYDSHSNDILLDIDSEWYD